MCSELFCHRTGNICHDNSEKRRERLTSRLNIPCTRQAGFSHGDALSVHEAVDIKSLTKASDEIQQAMKRLLDADNGEIDDSDGSRMLGRRSSTIVECPENPSTSDGGVRSSAGVESDAKSPKESASFVGKLRAMLQGLFSSFIDDATTSDAKLRLMPEIPPNDATQSNADANSEAMKSHKASPCMTRDSSCASLRETSTFISSQDIFERSMAARRKRLNPEEVGDDKEKTTMRSSDSYSNEVVKHVFNFVDE